MDIIAEGLANPQIAERLFISKRTVETHVAHLLRKLDVTTRAELIAKTLREGPIPRVTVLIGRMKRQVRRGLDG